LIQPPRKTLRSPSAPLANSIKALRPGHKAVHSCDATGGAPRTWQVAEHIGSLAIRKGGGAVAALGDGFYALNFDTGRSTKLVEPDPGKPRIRLNDGRGWLPSEARALVAEIENLHYP
jgi:hypothetical protein